MSDQRGLVGYCGPPIAGVTDANGSLGSGSCQGRARPCPTCSRAVWSLLQGRDEGRGQSHRHVDDGRGCQQTKYRRRQTKKKAWRKRSVAGTASKTPARSCSPSEDSWPYIDRIFVPQRPGRRQLDRKSVPQATWITQVDRKSVTGEVRPDEPTDTHAATLHGKSVEPGIRCRAIAEDRAAWIASGRQGCTPLRRAM
jgi:hypothetical protein